MNITTRRQFLRQLGLSAAALPFLPSLPSLAGTVSESPPQRIIFMFTPNGTIPEDFWPDETGADFKLKRILSPLEPFKNRMITLKGVCNKIGGDGDGHMRGISCLLTADQLLPGNIQGGGNKPAGWAGNISIDQEIKNFLQANAATSTRFGSLELGVAVPNRADPWTREAYAGPNQPLAPISDPYALFDKLYGNQKNLENLGSILDDVRDDLKWISAKVDPKEREMLDQHATFVREMEQDLQRSDTQQLMFPAPVLEQGVVLDNDGIPKISAMQIDLLVNAFANGMARVATLQYTNSVGQARMRWLDINDDHHHLSHEPDNNEEAREKLVKINTWLCQQLSDLARKLDAIPEPGGSGTMLDHTTIVWTNELGKGNSHSLDNLPFVMVGGGLGFKGGQALSFDNVPHNRLWMSVAHAFGHPISTFGRQEFCANGPLSLS
ncbi:DUF1552 domain-containing protein [Luteolibacter pohnpeiensis]|uniref:DUF1552 domain-containing protein n=1 Tax=Luteolibacter pohnpeiensis TaxID=454153 RepID=A0A934SCI5_9BACT|nr:DUF1552 domain-containing protein [Luteolibacter pohnpeiensis]MBK1883389.1 DUF1552 domain-containing protein [Luteolibacter pohnpeiensis]